MPSPPSEPPSPRSRFLGLDAYRVEREWRRYEGTPQRDLFRALRQRFVARHPGPAGWVADLGAGPGRFADALGRADSPRVLLDLSREALRSSRTARGPVRRSRGARHPVLGDAGRPPLQAGRFGTVALLGNVLGFSGRDWPEVLRQAVGLLAPGGTLLVEAAAGPGERSAYLGRLPAGAAGRALGGPRTWVLGRIRAEGFHPEPERKAGAGSFVRLDPDRLDRLLTRSGLAVRERRAVAPATGALPALAAVAQPDPRVWAALLELEEELGADPERLRDAAAYLVAAERPRDASGRDP